MCPFILHLHTIHSLISPCISSGNSKIQHLMSIPTHIFWWQKAILGPQEKQESQLQMPTHGTPFETSAGNLQGAITYYLGIHSQLCITCMLLNLKDISNIVKNVLYSISQKHRTDTNHRTLQPACGVVLLISPDKYCFCIYWTVRRSEWDIKATSLRSACDYGPLWLFLFLF